jgi:hexosaminidase
VYSFDPEKYPLVVGIDAPMWSELVTTEAAADNRMWPRLAAIAELGWSTQSNRQYEKFTLRLSALKPHLDKLGVNYYKEPHLSW